MERVNGCNLSKVTQLLPQIAIQRHEPQEAPLHPVCASTVNLAVASLSPGEQESCPQGRG